MEIDTASPVGTWPTRMSEVRDLATIPIWSDSEPNAAALLGVGRTNGYRLARSGEIPTIRLGRKIVVPCAALLRMLGVEQ